MSKLEKILIAVSLVVAGYGCSEDKVLVNGSTDGDSGVVEPEDPEDSDENEPGATPVLPEEQDDPEQPDDPPSDNPEPGNPPSNNPDPEDPEPENPGGEDPEVPEPGNPEPENPGGEDPEVPEPGNPEPENPGLEFPEDPDPENPDPGTRTPDPEDPEPEEPETGECTAASEGKTCVGDGIKHACGKKICRNSVCTDVPVAEKIVCRAAADVCDAEEVCSGTSIDCPSDKLAAAGTVCRAAQHSCDAAEKCDGKSKACPKLEVTNACTCPKANTIDSNYSLSEGSGVHAFKNKKDYAGFILKDAGTWSDSVQKIDSLGTKVSVTQLDFNRSMTTFSRSYTGFKKGYMWNSGDLTVKYWIPQGNAGGSKDGIDIKVVGWHYETGKESGFSGDKGVRLSFVNTTDSASVKYRHVLLAELTNDAAKIKAVENHVGGLAWAWPYLYEADTHKGMRVFDLTRIVKADTSDACSNRIGMYNGKLCAYGYAYVMPQVNIYSKAMGTNCTDFIFSYIALERPATGNSILAGEYFAYKKYPKTCMYSRLVRYPMGEGGKLKTTNGYVEPIGGWFTGDCNIQGGTTYTVNSKEYFLLTSTRGDGKIFRSLAGGKSSQAYTAKANQVGHMPEGIYITTKGNAWISTEGPKESGELDRALYYVDANKFIP